MNRIQNCGQVNGKWVVGYDGADVDGKYLSRVKGGFEKLCLVEMTRYDLAAADLEEARRGFYIVSTGKVLKGNPLNHARMMMRLRVLFDKMNANRVKGIFYEAPNSVSSFLEYGELKTVYFGGREYLWCLSLVELFVWHGYQNHAGQNSGSYPRELELQQYGSRG